jgi:hypothetical protein
MCDPTEHAVCSDPVVRVEWFDSHMETEPWWQRDDVEPGKEPIATVGFLLSSTEEWITVYQSDGKEFGIQGVYHIPRGCVKEVTPL